MISVAIPAFKAKYLKEAIESVLNQTYSDFELIIVNDASPENIKEITEYFNDPRIRYYENEVNLGRESVVKNWNKCLEYAKGEYFILFSDDDIYEKDLFQKYMELANKYHDVSLFRSRISIIDDKSSFISLGTALPEFEFGLDFIAHRILGYRQQFAVEFMYRTEKLKSFGGFVDFPLAWCSDDATNFKLSLVNGISSINIPLTKWRASKVNISKIGSLNDKNNSLDMFEIWAKDLLQSIVPKNDFEELLLDVINRNLPVRIYSLKRQAFNNYLTKNSKLLNYFNYFNIGRNYNIKKKHLIIDIIKNIFANA